MIEDKYEQSLKKGNTVAFIRCKLMVIGKIAAVNGHSLTVKDEENEKEYKIKSHKVSMIEED